jgi:hypothetical protein
MEHKVTITDADNPKFPLLVTCTCQYQCHCKTEAEADWRKRSHESAALWLAATKGIPFGHR